MKNDYVVAVAGNLNCSSFSASSFVAGSEVFEPAADGRVSFSEFREAYGSMYALCCSESAVLPDGSPALSANCRADAAVLAGHLSAGYSGRNNEADMLVSSLASASDSLRGSSSCCSCAAVKFNRLSLGVCSLGDADAFLVRGRRLVPIAPAADYPQGAEYSAVPNTLDVDIADGDYILLCSKSLSRALDEDSIVDCIAGHTVCSNSVDALLRRSRESHTREQVSLLLIGFNTSETALRNKRKRENRLLVLLLIAALIVIAGMAYVIFAHWLPDNGNEDIDPTASQSDVVSSADTVPSDNVSDSSVVPSDSDTSEVISDDIFMLFGLEIRDDAGDPVYTADETTLKHANQGFVQTIDITGMPEDVYIVPSLDPSPNSGVSAEVFIGETPIASDEPVSIAAVDNETLTVNIIRDNQVINTVCFKLEKVKQPEAAVSSDSDVQSD